MSALQGEPSVSCEPGEAPGSGLGEAGEAECGGEKDLERGSAGPGDLEFQACVEPPPLPPMLPSSSHTGSKCRQPGEPHTQVSGLGVGCPIGVLYTGGAAPSSP